MMEKKIYKTVDLCAGIGGIRRGFELTGRFENVLSAEIDKYACKTYKHLYGDDPNNDITSSEFKSLIKKIEYDVMLAGFPCQSFSRVGKALGFRGADKGTIFFHLVTIIRKTRPKAIFLENVENLIRHNNGETFRRIISVIDKDLDYKIIGVARNEYDDSIYDPSTFVRNSKYFGVPQSRPRTYIMAFDRMAFDGDALKSLPGSLPTHGDVIIYKDVNEIIEPGAPARFYMSSGYLETLLRHKERCKKKRSGFGYKIVNNGDDEHPIASTLMATGGSGKERNLVIDIQEGIAGKVLENKKTPLNDRCIRFMTPREWGKLQGFIGYGFMEQGVDAFSFPDGISIQQQYKQFGNAVTIPVAESMAYFMLYCFEKLNYI